MVKTKPIDVVSKKWSDRASVAEGDYAFGVENPKRDWAEATSKASKAWEAGIKEAITDRRFEGGVKKAGTDKWKKKAIEKGKDRYADGVRKSVDEYKKAMGEVLSVIEGVSLPDRGARGDPRNYERVKAVGDALHKYKLAKKKA